MGACGGGGGGDGSSISAPTGLTAISAPSGLSYASPALDTVGSPASTLNPTVVGSVSSYTIAPSLPPGLALNGSTGVISGTPMAIRAKLPRGAADVQSVVGACDVAAACGSIHQLRSSHSAENKANAAQMITKPHMRAPP
ncbi:MAG: Ig domain-containing protein, partial [Steroidobacteraceae bacterium]